MTNRHRYRYLGISVWTLLALMALSYRWGNAKGDQATTPTADIVSYFTLRNQTVSAIDPTNALRLYDPIFWRDEEGVWRQAGYVANRHPNTSGASTLELTWHHRTVPPNSLRFVQYHQRGRLQDVVRMMLPEEKRQRIQQRLAVAFEMHSEQLSKAFVPLVQQSVTQSLPVIEDEFRLAIERHRFKLEEIADRYNRELVNERLVPLAKNEILPIVRQHGQPTAEKIGRQVWNRASVWRFGWRAVYDSAPLTERNLVQEEWRRFLQQEATPVIEEHLDEIVEAVQRILADTASHPEVRSTIADVAKQIAADREARELIKLILRETLVDNERLHQVWSGLWNSPEAQAAVDVANAKMEPVIRQIGDELFGSRDGGIDPMFALVLRNQIFGKDRRWIVAIEIDAMNRDSGVPIIKPATDTMTYPVVYMAAESVETAERRP